MPHSKLNVVLCWHMHQPWYRDGIQGDSLLPWVYLHAIKDYSDMATHLEQHSAMKAVVNFAPVLLEQLHDYDQQLADFLQTGKATSDRLLNLLSGSEPIPTDTAARRQILVECQRCNAERMITPYPAFQQLLDSVDAPQVADAREGTLRFDLSYLSEQYFLDLLTWYHLVWLGQSLRNQDDVQALFAKQQHFSQQDRHTLLSIMQSCISGLIPRYRALAESGQVELSMSPYMHPIIPLLQDFNSMDCAQPDAPKPEASHYPGGKERARWHMRHGLAIFKQHFHHYPKGVWLSEGALSEAAIGLLDEFNIQWTASGEGVWHNSCRLSGLQGDAIDSKQDLFKPHVLPDQSARIFFRDDGLSDLIGFKYSDWHAKDAAADFREHLERIADFLGEQAEQQVVPIILDGENAWEYYPDNGFHFLDELYQQLSHSDRLETGHFSTLSQQLSAKPLPKLCAGSWVYGSFSTWIGSTDKNRGWDYLVAAKQCCDQALATGDFTDQQRAAIHLQLGICEGSDWFWWFGDYNASDSVSDFEKLYRQQLSRLYGLLNLPAPAVLDKPISQGGAGVENAGTMRSNT